MRRGDVWWAELPESGRRPVLVLTRNEALSVLKRVVCAPATRTVRGIPTEIPVDEDDGMPAPCAFSFDNLETVPRAALTHRICALGPERDGEICEALAASTGC